MWFILQTWVLATVSKFKLSSWISELNGWLTVTRDFVPRIRRIHECSVLNLIWYLLIFIEWECSAQTENKNKHHYYSKKKPLFGIYHILPNNITTSTLNVHIHEANAIFGQINAPEEEADNEPVHLFDFNEIHNSSLKYLTLTFWKSHRDISSITEIQLTKFKSWRCVYLGRNGYSAKIWYCGFKPQNCASKM